MEPKYIIVGYLDGNYNVVWHETLYEAILDADVRNTVAGTHIWKAAEVVQEVTYITQLFARIEYWLIGKLNKLRNLEVHPHFA